MTRLKPLAVLEAMNLQDWVMGATEDNFVERGVADLILCFINIAEAVNLGKTG